MITKIKAVLKLATAALLSFTIAPLCAAQSPFALLSQHADQSRQEQEMGFTEPGQASSFIANKVIPKNAKGNALTFSLDLRFGSDTQPVRGILPLILYNSEQIKVVGISNIVNASLLRPARAKLKKYISDYTPDTPPALTTVAGEAISANADKSLALTWLDISGISAVSGATPARPVRVATIKFRWIPGAERTSHIGITHSELGVARDFRGASIKVQGPAAVASVSAQPETINVNDNPSPISVKCSLSHPVADKTTCILGLKLDGPDAPLASTFKLSIRAGKTSASKKLKIRPKAADSGGSFAITLESAESGGEEFQTDGIPAKIFLKSPAVVVSESNAPVEEITVEEGETKKLQVRLAAPPDGKVVVRAFRATVRKVTVTPASFAFTADNWNKPKTVHISSADDKIADGNRSVTVEFRVDHGKSGATNYANARAASVLATITENDEARLAVTATLIGRPDNILVAGWQGIVITATLEGGGVFDTPKSVAFKVKNTGSAEAGVHYDLYGLGNIIIPAHATSASSTPLIHVRSSVVNTIAIGVTLLNPDTPAPDLYLKIGRCSWDVDANGSASSSDAIMIGRYLMLGMHGPELTHGVSHTSHEEVVAYLRRIERVLNVSALKPKSDDQAKRAIEQQKINKVNSHAIARYFVLSARGDALVNGLDPRPDPNTVLANIRACLP